VFIVLKNPDLSTYGLKSMCNEGYLLTNNYNMFIWGEGPYHVETSYELGW
jgi:hypothetical protein